MILRNAIQTPDGTILESRSRHDYKTHIDAISKEEYMVDGGLNYFRSNVNKIPAKCLSLESEDDHSEIREGFSWGTYGIDGTSPLTYIILKDMESNHIQAIIDNIVLHTDMMKVFFDELNWRKKSE